MNYQTGLFDFTFLQNKLSKKGDPLEKLDEIIDWKKFENALTLIFKKNDPKGPGGRPAYNYTMMFKILVLQRLYNLSDESTEFQILDRVTFKRFLGLHLNEHVPDATTIWLFREALTESNQFETLFQLFSKMLDSIGIKVSEGSIIDASFVEVPKQRNSREENKQVKNGEIPQEWENNPYKLSQKDTEATWTKKNNKTFYGYKNHVKADVKTKLIKEFKVTTASIHDSQVFEDLVDLHFEKRVYADSAYYSKESLMMLSKKGIEPQIVSKAYRNRPLTEIQKQVNKCISKIRVRVEHIFGFMQNSMDGDNIRCIGIKRATTLIGLTNLVYNMCRGVQLLKVKIA